MDERIIELEIRLTHMEESIEMLSQTIIEQRTEIDALLLQIELLEKRLQAQAEANIAKPDEETPPPHY